MGKLCVGGSCRPPHQSSNDGLTPFANHIRSLLNVIISTLRRWGEQAKSQGVSSVHSTSNNTVLSDLTNENVL